MFKTKIQFLVVATLIIAGNAWAKLDLQDFGYKSTGLYSVKVEKTDVNYLLYINDASGKALIVYKAPHISSRFIRGGFMKIKDKAQVFFYSIWNRGAHGEEIIIFDVEKKKNVFFYSSGWPMEIEYKGGALLIKGAGAIKKDGIVPEEESRVWKGE